MPGSRWGHRARGRPRRTTGSKWAEVVSWLWQWQLEQGLLVAIVVVNRERAVVEAGRVERSRELACSMGKCYRHTYCIFVMCNQFGSVPARWSERETNFSGAHCGVRVAVKAGMVGERTSSPGCQNVAHGVLTKSWFKSEAEVWLRSCFVWELAILDKIAGTRCKRNDIKMGAVLFILRTWLTTLCQILALRWRFRCSLSYRAYSSLEKRSSHDVLNKSPPSFWLLPESESH